MVNEYVQEINKKDITQDHYLGLLSWGCYPKPIWQFFLHCLGSNLHPEGAHCSKCPQTSSSHWHWAV